MAESHKFTTAEKLREAFPDAPIAYNKSRNTVSVYNEKEGVKVPVEKGQFVVKIADRYEVHDEEPDNAKPAEAPKASKKAETKEAAPSNSENTPKAVEGSTTVEASELASKPGPQTK
jgi:hypothetical protein